LKLTFRFRLYGIGYSKANSAWSDRLSYKSYNLSITEILLVKWY